MSRFSSLKLQEDICYFDCMRNLQYDSKNARNGDSDYKLTVTVLLRKQQFKTVFRWYRSIAWLTAVIQNRLFYTEVQELRRLHAMWRLCGRNGKHVTRTWRNYFTTGRTTASRALSRVFDPAPLSKRATRNRRATFFRATAAADQRCDNNAGERTSQ